MVWLRYMAVSLRAAAEPLKAGEVVVLQVERREELMRLTQAV